MEPRERMTVIERNHLKSFGRGRQPMLFAHGFGCDQNMWRYITPAFEERYRIILFDHVGSGKSDLAAYSRTKYASLDGYASDVLDICRELALEDVVFVGHSVSAMIGVLAAIREPQRFSRLVLIGPSPCYLNKDDYQGGFAMADLEGLLDFMDSNFLGWSAAIAPKIMGNPDRPELGGELTASFCTTDPDIARQFARVDFALQLAQQAAGGFVHRPVVPQHQPAANLAPEKDIRRGRKLLDQVQLLVDDADPGGFGVARAAKLHRIAGQH